MSEGRIIGISGRELTSIFDPGPADQLCDSDRLLLIEAAIRVELAVRARPCTYHGEAGAIRPIACSRAPFPTKP